MMVEDQVTALFTDIIGWLRDHAPAYALVSTKPGATEPELLTLEKELARPVPMALKAMLRVANGDVYIGEYATLSSTSIARVWNIGRQLVADGTYANFKPHHDSGGRLKPGWWHAGLIPVLEDSGGNQLCIDLDPGPHGVVGQMVWWEIHEGPIPHGADSLLTLLRAHWQHLASGAYDTPEAWEQAGCWELAQL